MRSRASVVFMLAAVLLLTAACEQPPDKEIQQAEGAVAAARAAGADQYAHDEFAAAVDALKRAHDAVGDRDYRLALNNALDSRERAETAAKMGSDAKGAARAGAERQLTTAVDTLAAADAELKALEGPRLPAKTLAQISDRVANARGDVQKARTAFDKGDYLASNAAASAATAQLTALKRDIEAAVAPAARRRR